MRIKNQDVPLHLQNIRVFASVYLFVLLTPFALAFWTRPFLENLFQNNWWMVPLILATLFATAGSVIFLYGQSKVEDRLMREQRKYQEALRRASLGMGQIRDLKRLLQLIVHVVTRTIRIRYCKIYLLHEASKQYVLKASRGLSHMTRVNDVIPSEAKLVEYLQTKKDPVFLEAIRSAQKNSFRQDIRNLRQNIPDVSNALVLPCFIENRLIAIFILGEKRSGDAYTYEDMSLFAILANQSALAIENAEFYDDMKKTHEQLFKAEKMATIGTMSGGLSHQINNRLHAMGFIAGDAIDTIKIREKKSMNEKTAQVLKDIKESFLRIEDNVKRGGEVVGGLLKYTQTGTGAFEALEFKKVLESAVDMLKFKIKIKNIAIERKFSDDLPLIKGNATQLQEVFFNIIDNSYDAMMERRFLEKDRSYKPTIEISARKKGKNIEIIFKDNGIGVKKEDRSKLFTAFFTTKIENKKGTGLGLFVIRQIIEENHSGKIEFISEYKQGAQTKILLPVAV